MKSDISHLVSVLMPVYNAEQFIGTAIESILNQTYENIELIIVDDGSTDNSLSEVRKFTHDDRVILISQTNGGAAAARNAAFNASHGDYIMYMDADDCIDQRKIELQIKTLTEAGDADAVASACWDFFHSDIAEATFPLHNIYKSYNRPVDMLAEMLNSGEMMQTSCWLAPRHIIEETGGWNEQISINDDGVFFTKVLMRASRIVFCPDAYVYYRRGHASLSTKDIYSDAKVSALLLSYEEQARELLATAPLPEIKRGLARNFSLVMCKAIYGSSAYNTARNDIERLGLVPCHPHKGSKGEFISRIIGFENFLKYRPSWQRSIHINR